MICGCVSRVTCLHCMECSVRQAHVFFLRIGRGFTRLDPGTLKPVHPCDDVYTLLMRLFGEEQK